jgi:hypothetical protein
MRLQVYTSKADASDPNMVSLQHPDLIALPTILVCPMRSAMALTPLRVEIFWGGGSYVVACDLIRPINRKALRVVGELDEQTSQTIVETFLRSLPG